MLQLKPCKALLRKVGHNTQRQLRHQSAGVEGLVGIGIRHAFAGMLQQAVLVRDALGLQSTAQLSLLIDMEILHPGSRKLILVFIIRILLVVLFSFPPIDIAEIHKLLHRQAVILCIQGIMEKQSVLIGIPVGILQNAVNGPVMAVTGNGQRRVILPQCTIHRGSQVFLSFIRAVHDLCCQVVHRCIRQHTLHQLCVVLD